MAAPDEAPETPSRKRKRPRFLFDEIESDFHREEDNVFLVGFPRIT